MRATLIVLLLVAVGAQAQKSSKPRITPFFDRVDDGPAFFVECRNTSQHKVSSRAAVWPGMAGGTVRIDGVVVPFDNQLGPGLSMEVAPDQPWRGILVFRQSELRYFPAVKFGALKRVTRLQPIAAGRHIIAVQCEGVWSDDFEFYWDEEAAPPPASSLSGNE